MDQDEEAQREEARRENQARLLRLLRESAREEIRQNPLSIDVPRTTITSITLSQFLQNVKKYTRGIHLRRFRTEGGYFTLQPPRLEEPDDDEPNSARVVSIDGLLHEKRGGTLLRTRLISFTVTSLADGRILIKVACLHSAIAEYYHTLLKRVERLQDGV